MSLQDPFTDATFYFGRTTAPEHLHFKHFYLFPSKAPRHTLPIAPGHTLLAVQDMDHHSPVMVRIKCLYFDRMYSSLAKQRA